MEAALPLIGSLAFMLLFALMTASIAERKGRSRVRWGIFGAFFGLIAILVAALVPRRRPVF